MTLIHNMMQTFIFSHLVVPQFFLISPPFFSSLLLLNIECLVAGICIRKKRLVFFRGAWPLCGTRRSISQGSGPVKGRRGAIGPFTAFSPGPRRPPQTPKWGCATFISWPASPMPSLSQGWDRTPHYLPLLRFCGSF